MTYQPYFLIETYLAPLTAGVKKSSNNVITELPNIISELTKCVFQG